MKYLKLFESFEQPEGTGKKTFWEIEKDNEVIRITLDDVYNYLDNVVEIDPNEVKHLLIDVERDPKRVEAADLSYPIVVTKLNGKYNNIIDGQHRVVKALIDGLRIKSRVLDLDDAPEEFKLVFNR
jgi:hypothetical protein